MIISVTFNVTREIDHQPIDIEVEATGIFYQGELEDWDYKATEDIWLTQAEKGRAVDLLLDAAADDWDENQWQSEREHHD